MFLQIWEIKQVKRLTVTIVGLTILGIGIAMIILPGPAIAVIPLALAILATEFAWARRVLNMVRERIRNSQADEKQPPNRKEIK
jgi:uncharacterized protein (TIGR02611 family)